jgi:hypothetical protein
VRRWTNWTGHRVDLYILRGPPEFIATSWRGLADGFAEAGTCGDADRGIGSSW